MREPIVITGTGLVCGLGDSAETAWRNVLAGRRGVGPMPAMEDGVPPGSDGGQAVDLPADFGPGLPREARYLRYAITQALHTAGTLPYPPGRVAVVLGTTLHGMRAAGRFLRTGDYAQLKDFLAGDVTKRAIEGLNLHGGHVTTCSACSSGLGAIALAVTLLRSGEADAVVAGGYDPISEYAWAGFNALRLVSGPPLRPFARGRCGMKVAEAYATVVLERDTDARRRAAPRLACVAGVGETADAHHLTQPHPAGTGAATAMRQAIAAAGMTPADIGLAAAHATGTPDNDAAEFAALSGVFGDRLPATPVVAFKGHLGHTLGGAGAAELILSAMALRDGVLPPTVLDAGEAVEFDGLRLTQAPAASATIGATLNTSLGFGGANTSVVLMRAAGLAPSPVYSRERAGVRAGLAERAQVDARPHPRPLPLSTTGEGVVPRRSVVITGVGLILPGVYDRTTLAALPPWAAGPIDMARVEATLNARRTRRMSDYVKLTLAAVAMAGREAFGDAPLPADTAAILGTVHGSANFSETYYRQVITEGAAAANPVWFAEGVPNAAAAQLSLMLGLTGPCQTIVGTRTAGLDALRLATLRIASGQWDRAVVSAGEETSALVAAAYDACQAGPAYDTAGAAAVVLESADSATARGARVLATITHAAAAGGPDAVAALVHALRQTPAAGRLIGDAATTVAARRAERGEAVADMPGVIADRFSVTPLATLVNAIASGTAEALLVCSTDPTATAAVVRIEVP